MYLNGQKINRADDKIYWHNRFLWNFHQDAIQSANTSYFCEKDFDGFTKMSLWGWWLATQLVLKDHHRSFKRPPGEKKISIGAEFGDGKEYYSWSNYQREIGL